MLIDDDERTLQVLEMISGGGVKHMMQVVVKKIRDGTLTVDFIDTIQMAMGYVSDKTGNLTHEGRAKRDRLRKLKELIGDVAG